MNESASGWIARGLSVWLLWVVRRPIPVVITVLLLAVLAGVYAGMNLGVNTDPTQMLDESLPFRQTYDRYRAEFPNQVQTILVVLEAPTPEQAHDAADKVTLRMAEHSGLFASVDWPQGDAFFKRHGLLFRDIDTLNRLGDRMSAAQPLLARLAKDPSLAGLFGLLADAHERGTELGMDFSEFDEAVAYSINATLAGQYAPLSWQSLLSGREREENLSAPSIYRETLIVRPMLDYGRIRAGRQSLEALRQIRASVGLDDGPVRMYITGSVALADDELNSVLTGARRAGLLSLVLVALVMAVGLRSITQVGLALLSLLAGLLITAGIAALVVGRVNMVSVAFTVLYVGLGVNYAIHYMLRYRELCLSGMRSNFAVVAAGVGLRGALVLSALTTAIGFAAFIPTEYKGVAELGLIAAYAMLITLLVSYTLLPALISLVPAKYSAAEAKVREPGAKAWLELPLRRASGVRWIAAVLAVLAALAASQVRFDSDPLNLRDPKAESVTVLRTLLAERATGHRNLQVLASTEAEVKALTEELNGLPEVEQVLNLFDFLPDQQEEKLLLLDDLNWVLGPELLTADFQPQDRAIELQRVAVERLLALLEPTATPAQKSLSYALQHLLDADQIRQNSDIYNDIGRKLLGLLPLTVERLRNALAVQDMVTLESMPEAHERRWLSAEGSYLIQVFPASGATDVRELVEFVDQVQAVAPAVTGMPVIQLVSGEAISRAFKSALTWAVVGIAALLLVLLRSLAATFKVLTPLLLGGLITAALMVLLDIPFNFANVVALPLLLGVGVDNGVHLVYRHRAGQMLANNVLRTATARGIVFGALTTILSFGNLAFSPHTGTASMGIVLAIGLALMVLTTLIVLPAMLRKT